MGLLKTLAGVFRRGRPTTIDVPSESFGFLGEPAGDVKVLKEVLKNGLSHDAGLRRAYLTRIYYEGDKKIRVALCVDTESPPQQVIRPLTAHCAEHVSSIDIMFFSDLDQHLIDKLESIVAPFCESPRSR